MQSSVSESGSESQAVFARVAELEAALGRALKDAERAEQAASEVERLRDAARPMRPHANSVFAYFSTPAKLPPVPPLPVEPDVEAIRTERSRGADALAGPAYRSDAESARARIDALQVELDAAHTRLARANQRARGAQRDLDRRRARAKLDDRFSAKETLQVLALLGVVLGGGVLLALLALAAKY